MGGSDARQDLLCPGKMKIFLVRNGKGPMIRLRATDCLDIKTVDVETDPENNLLRELYLLTAC